MAARADRLYMEAHGNKYVSNMLNNTQSNTVPTQGKICSSICFSSKDE